MVTSHVEPGGHLAFTRVGQEQQGLPVKVQLPQHDSIYFHWRRMIPATCNRVLDEIAARTVERDWSLSSWVRIVVDCFNYRGSGHAQAETRRTATRSWRAITGRMELLTTVAQAGAIAWIS